MRLSSKVISGNFKFRQMKKVLLFSLLAILMMVQAKPQDKLLTAAERSDFKSTSDYHDVMSFIGELKKISNFIRVENIGTTIEGRGIPLMIIADPLPVKDGKASGDGRVVVFVQANIHAGEVEGKEATLMFARDILKAGAPGYFKDVIFLICPLFNPDGNEQISPLNRTYQNGPVNGVGVRHNGQFLDLNRDAMKVESPEVRSLLTNVLNKWDPAVFMDCHTTDGSYHVEPVTFTWMVNPAGDTSLIRYMRTKMVPQMSATLLNKYRTENCFYGEFEDLSKPEDGWFYDASEPRYIVNYIGLRNRLAILNENYVYADFRSRVYGCYNLIKSLADYASSHKAEIMRLVKNADLRCVNRGLDPAPADSFPIEYKVRPVPDKVTIKTFEADEVNGATGWMKYRRSDRQKTVTVPYYIDYYPSGNVKFPFAYLITSDDPRITGLLSLHGIRIEKLKEHARLEIEKFSITDLKGASRLNQGHYTESITGKFVRDTVDFPAGTIVVRTSQPLASLACYLLEPLSNDGLLTWNFLDRCLVPQWGQGFNPYPVYRLMEKRDLKSAPFLPAGPYCW